MSTFAPLAGLLGDMSELDPRKLKMAISAPRALGPLTNAAGATPPFVESPTPPPSPLALPTSKPINPTVAPAAPSLSDSIAGMQPPDPNDPKYANPKVGVAKRIVGTLGEMWNEPEIREASYNWLHPGQQKLALDTTRYKQQLEQAKEANTAANVESEIAARTTPKPTKDDEEWTVVPNVLGPNGEPVQQERKSGQIRVVGTPGVTVKEPATKDTKAVAGTVKGQPAWGVQTDKGWVDPETNAPLPDFRPPLNYAQGVAPTKTETRIDPDTQLPTDYTYNPKTGKYDIKQGISGAGAYAGRMEQAGAIGRAGDTLISTVTANKAKLGNVQAILNAAFTGSPLSDPTQSGIAAQIASFAALNPAMHGFRGTEALRQFEQLTGGPINNPESLIAAVRAIQGTAGAINPAVTPQQPTAPAGPWSKYAK